MPIAFAKIYVTIAVVKNALLPGAAGPDDGEPGLWLGNDSLQ